MSTNALPREAKVAVATGSSRGIGRAITMQPDFVQEHNLIESSVSAPTQDP